MDGSSSMMKRMPSMLALAHASVSMEKVWTMTKGAMPMMESVRGL